jgi:hypothetical protein
LEDNPQFPISVAPAIDEIVDGSRQVFTPSVSNRPSSVTGPNNSSGSQLRLTRPQAKTTQVGLLIPLFLAPPWLLQV